VSGNLVLIASYPKSGNTWTRIVFERLRRGSDISINNLSGGFHGVAGRVVFDDIAPVNAADLRDEEVYEFLPGVYRGLAAEAGENVFLKVHNELRRTRRGEWLYPPDCVAHVIYIVRHPYDVAVSYAHHSGANVKSTVRFMADETSVPRLRIHLPEALPHLFFGAWSNHVSSWLDGGAHRVTLARYEDIHADPVGQFLRLANAAGLAVTKEDVFAAVEASRFDRMQAEEQEQGFRERPETSSSFFRSGRPRSWEGLLDESLREQIVRDHGPTMERLGYTADGDAVALPTG
jgi:aryl sulfotransferase